MPPLHIRQVPIASPTASPPARAVHPSPRREGLGLEAMTPRELIWWGQRFGIDTPYLAILTGFGEAIPLYGFDELEVNPANVVELHPPTG